MKITIKIILLLVVLNSIVFAISNEPKWLISDPDNKAKYFRGVSTWYITDDAMTRETSQKDALHSGYSKVSDYFGLNIKSTLNINKTSDNYGVSTSIKKNIKTKTNQLIFDMKPIKSYIQYSENKENFRLHILLKLDKTTESKIKKEMEKDKKEFEALKTDILKHIERKDFFKAQNLLEIAKGKRSAYIDDTLSKIETRLTQLKNGILIATLDINKKQYLPNENINIEVSLNSKGYLYLFYDTGSDVEMLYPNKYQRNNYLDKQEMISFPNDNINQLLAYEESKGLDTSIYAIASKENLVLQRYKSDMIDGIYIFNKDGEYTNIINRCIEQAKCIKTKIDFTISDKTNYPNIKLIFNTENDLKNKIIKSLKSKGIVSKNGNRKIIFDIKSENMYSDLLEVDIKKYLITANYFFNNKKTNSSYVECTSVDLLTKIEDMINQSDTEL